jgi:hypothetical protein
MSNIKVLSRQKALELLSKNLRDSINETSIFEVSSNLSSALNKLDIQLTNEDSPLEFLSKEELQALYDDLTMLSNSQLEGLMNKFSKVYFDPNTTYKVNF